MTDFREGGRQKGHWTLLQDAHSILILKELTVFDIFAFIASKVAQSNRFPLVELKTFFFRVKEQIFLT